MDFSKNELAAFNPQDRAYRGKLWVRVLTPDTVYHHIFWGRIATLLGGFAVMTWLGLAAAAWGFVKYRRGYSDVSYFDLAFYPLRREQYRIGMGRSQIAAGRAAFEQKNYREGYSLLTAGLARVPADAAARRYVAIAEVRFGRTDRALRTLAEGLPHARVDLDYLKLLFGLLLETHDDDRVIALARDLLPARPDGKLVHQFVALQAATAHYHRGRTETAERLVGDWGLENALEGQILLARCDWDWGLRELALQRLVQQVARFPKRDELYLELIRLQRDSGKHAEARRFALLRQFNDPTSPGPRIDLLHTYRASGDTEAGERELTEFLARFGDDANALLLLEWFAVDTVQPELAERVHALAREKKFPLHAFNLARVQTALAAKDPRRALTLAAEALRADHTGVEHVAALLNALRAVALFGTGESSRGQVMLGAFLKEPRLRASDALLLARQLANLGFPAQAHRVLERACQIDPLNQQALAELIRLDAAAGDRTALAQNLPRLLAMRKHSRATLMEILQRLDQPGDALLREQIQSALARPAAP
ncbi:MAG: tetratricopeptide repeat protein [Opitutus sp.]|nr:tetratricopeptide repeat protein [Opitutus sp.]